MTDPRIVTDADTVARLAKAAKTIRRALGEDQLVFIDTDTDIAQVAVAQRSNDGIWVAVGVEAGDVWVGGIGTPQAATAPDTDPPEHDNSEALRHSDQHFFSDGACACTRVGCCESLDGCICRWGCTIVGPHHPHSG